MTQAEPILAEPAPAPEPIAATRVWCFGCRAPRPFRNRALEPASRQRLAGFWGEALVCTACGTTVATVFVEGEGSVP